MFRYDMNPTIRKPTRVKTNTAAAVDHIITNVIINTEFKTGILKSCISNHSAIILVLQIGENQNRTTNQNNMFTSEFLMKTQ